MVAAVDHLVGVGQDHPVRGHTELLQQPELGDPAGPALAVGQQRGPDPGRRDGRGLEDPPVAGAGPVQAPGHLDHAGAVRRAADDRSVQVVGVDALGQLPDEQLGQLLGGEQLAPVPLAVEAGVVQAGGGDDVHAGAAADGGQLDDVAAGVGRHGVDHGAQPGGHAGAQLVDGVVDALEGDPGVDQLGDATVDDQVLVGVADPEPVAGDVAEHGPDDAHDAAAISGVRMAPAPPGRPEPAEREVARVGAHPARPAPPPCRRPGPWPCTGPWSARPRGRRGWPRSSGPPPARCWRRGPAGPGTGCRRPRRRAGTARSSPSLVVVLDGRPAEADLVVELAGREHVVGGEPDVAVDPARLPDPDLAAEGDQLRPLVARHLVDQEPGVLEGLAAPGHLGLGEQPRVGRVDHPAALARVEGTWVMIVAVIPSTGVTWSEPSRRGRS